MTPRFLERPGSTDRSVIREIWEENVYHVSADDLSGSGVVIDVGANIGAFSLYAAHHGARRVLAFEPEADNFRTLHANLSANPTLARVIQPVQAAIWSHDGEVTVRGALGDATVDEGSEPGVRVPALALDHVFEEHQVTECDMLKIDVEGAEYPIFGGVSTATLNRCRRIALEFHAAPDEVFGRMTATLTRTHKFYVLGSVDRGGYIWAERY